jgi:hypothetical protein
MIYAQLSVFKNYAAFVTADNEESFRDEFRKVVESSLFQYENCFGAVGMERKERIKKEMVALAPVPLGELPGLSYDLRLDRNGIEGIISVEKVFTSKADVESYYQEYIDELNQDISEDDEKWAVFDGGFFPSKQGFEIDELFK